MDISNMKGNLIQQFGSWNRKIEPRHDKTNKVACAPSEDSDQPGRPPSLIRHFAVRMKKAWGPKLPTDRTAKTLIRLEIIIDWS